MGRGSGAVVVAAGLGIVVFVVVVLVLVFVSFWGVDATSVQRKCRGHEGVASVSSSWGWKDKTLVVCRDGSVWDGLP